MPINRVYLENFRLFQKKDLILSDDKNFIQGPNGSGKTSILESIEILVNSRSFRTQQTKDCIKHNTNFFKASIKGSCINQEIYLKGTNSRNGRLSFSRKLNEKTAKKGSLFFLQTVLAKNLRMIEGEPDLRRDHLNSLMFHVKPSSYKTYLSYNKILKQRNKALKSKLGQSQISSWSKQLAKIGVNLSKDQYEFFNYFRSFLLEELNTSEENKKFKFLEKPDVRFSKGWERSKSFQNSLDESIEKDIALGFTSQGPHRMDYEFYIKGKKASSVLSRGQLKILILLVFLLNNSLINSSTKSETILLIDDLGSELDADNLQLILGHISKAPNQIILTGIQGEDLEKIVSKFSNFKRINL